VARLEREVEEAEAALATLEDELADASHWADPERSARSTARHQRARRRLADAEARWEQAAAELDG
jgi:ATP-binding cassette subfamily F protein 3